MASRRARERQNARPWEPSSTTEAWLGGDGPDSELGDWSDGCGDEDEDGGKHDDEGSSSFCSR